MIAFSNVSSFFSWPASAVADNAAFDTDFSEVRRFVEGGFSTKLEARTIVSYNSILTTKPFFR
jgi:hypothetical protein